MRIPLAYLLSHLISIISHEYTIPNLGDYEAFDAAGNKHIGSNLILMFSVEGAPAKLDMTNQVTSILESDEPQIRTHLGYLAKAVVLEYEHFPDHSIIELFKIIENNVMFPLYDKFYALRNVLAHSPAYFPNTIKYFKEYFKDSTFDYLIYEPDNKIIILNLHSNKTQKELNKLLKELMNEIRKFFKI